MTSLKLNSRDRFKLLYDFQAALNSTDLYLLESSLPLSFHDSMSHWCGIPLVTSMVPYIPMFPKCLSQGWVFCLSCKALQTRDWASPGSSQGEWAVAPPPPEALHELWTGSQGGSWCPVISDTLNAWKRSDRRNPCHLSAHGGWEGHQLPNSIGSETAQSGLKTQNTIR